MVAAYLGIGRSFATTMILSLALFCTAVQAQNDYDRDRDRRLRDRTLQLFKALNVNPRDGAGIGILVVPGEKADAEAYYKRIGQKLNFNFLDTTLTDLLIYLGYSDLQAGELETLAPQLLMQRYPSERVLASRFFAPKIVNFNVRDDAAPNPHTAGWRKLVRFLVNPGSAADKAGISTAYILFNYFEANPARDPFAVGNESVNNQVMLVPKDFKKEVEDSVFWAVYQPAKNGYRIGLALNAGFDFPQSSDSSTTRDYFVPHACAHCHGHDSENGGPARTGMYPFGKINYLDTDQWYDMVDYDFAGTKAGPHDALFDGGPDRTSSRYAQAFDVLRKLNQEIRVQNIASARSNGRDAYKIRAIETWLALHSGNNNPKRPAERAFVSAPGLAWNPNNVDEQRLLELLNRYCFRCHSSMYYHVFDRPAVVRKQEGIADRVIDGSMPQGRDIDQATRDELVRLVLKLQN